MLKWVIDTSVVQQTILQVVAVHRNWRGWQGIENIMESVLDVASDAVHWLLAGVGDANILSLSVSAVQSVELGRVNNVSSPAGLPNET